MLKLSSLIILLFACFSYGQSPHGSRLKQDCSECHSANTWRIDPAKIRFRHETTGFKLSGQHQSLECRRCHSTLVFDAEKPDCISCHKDIHKNSVSADCKRCHNTNSWLIPNISDLHNKTRFPLAGRHISAECRQCHVKISEFTFETAGIECSACHIKDFNSASKPDHKSAGFSTNCSQCHNFTDPAWSRGVFNHQLFPLTGVHNITSCVKCHTQSGKFSGLSTSCYSCHRSNYENSRSVNHIAAGFETNCLKCHTTAAGWKPASFNHNLLNFKLTGAHISRPCVSCHTVTYKGTSSECYSCHKTDYENPANNPNHISGSIPTSCTDCHLTLAWKPASFDHSKTNFALTGRHSSVSCGQCHVTSAKPSTDCYSCHRASYENPSNSINHSAAGFNTACSACHNTSAWKPASFSHAFPISTGKHRNLLCGDCHTNRTSYTDFTCISCHEHNQTDMASEHSSVSGYNYNSASCFACHPTGSSSGAFNHNSSVFPLTGAHVTTACVKCHTAGYPNTPTDCNSCHSNNYNTANLRHSTAGISRDCAACHTTTAWIPSMLNHASSGFELTGKHLSAQCDACHKGTLAGLQPACYSCHRTQYESADGHVSQSYPTFCEKCHNTNLWTLSVFNHGQTSFPLTGAHTQAKCSDCHKTTLAGTSKICRDCHLTQYQGAVNPNHTTLALPSTCESCHTTVAGWNPALFTVHSNYYVLQGAHVSVDCRQCHTTNYSVVLSKLCKDCHTSDYTATVNPPHSRFSSRFPYTCENCHSFAAGWKPATFNHSFKPLGSRHGSLTCVQCHALANYYEQCISCHQSDFREGHSNNPGQSKDCWLSGCHTMSSFGGSNSQRQIKGKE